MLATGSDLGTFLSLTPTNPKQATYVALANLLAPFADRLVKKYVGYAVEQAPCVDYHPLISTRPSLSQGFTEDDEFLAYEGSPQGARPIRQGRGNSRDTLSLFNLPIRSITAIYENPSAWLNPLIPRGDWLSNPSFHLTEGQEFQVDWDSQDSSNQPICQSGFVYRVGAVWSLQARSVYVTYSAGYSPTELANEHPEFKMAALLTGAHLFYQARLLGLSPGMGNSGIVLAEALDDYSVTYAPPQKMPTVLMEDLPPGAKMLLEELVRMSKRI